MGEGLWVELDLGAKSQGRQCTALKRITPSRVMADKRQAHRFTFVLGLRTVNIIREGASVDEETADTFSVVVEKLD